MDESGFELVVGSRVGDAQRFLSDLSVSPLSKGLLRLIHVLIHVLRGGSRWLLVCLIATEEVHQVCSLKCLGVLSPGVVCG